ncbi:MAG: outer membrane lipoprotein-sorting protein [Desulfobacula sp.]|uniref:outer membrane lipoprotein-sorting protein n=1 Tax=Desulfobacula sp. TaxID=2593537 RepID=UPI0025BF3362|nr:outer membrane lipoprotein-sorting protein [Desulfobacula sp.]MCD4719127.1 outer membrane lipoprotein-sorting protein [Desulfobacula sp.]
MKKTYIIFIILMIFISSSYANEAKDIIEKVLDRDDGTTEIGRVRLSTCAVIKKGKKIVCKSSPRVKVMELIRKDYGPNEKDHKTVTIIIEPAGEKGIGFLQYDYEQKNKETDQWLYLSALGKVKRIVSGNENEPKTGSFFGSELSYEDMEKRHIDDYTYQLLGRETYAKRPCFVIESTPVKERAAKSNYSKSLDWVDQERHMILKSILFNRQGKKFKKIYFGKIKEISNIFVPMQIAVLNLETGRRTLMSYEKIALNVTVDDDFLTQRTLTDGAFRKSCLKKYQAAY